MKRIILSLTSIITLVLIFGYTCKSELKENKFKEIWKTDAVFKTPESVLFDEESGLIYVSNVNVTDQNPWSKDKNGFISKLSKTGEVLDLEWVKGISSPKGLGLYDGILYVSDVDELVAISISKAKVIKKYLIEGATQLNDVAVGKDGKVYVTDMGTGKIHILENGIITTWKSGLNKPNGIFIEEDRILTASAADGSFIAHDIKTKKETLINSDMKSGDGIEATISGDYLVSNWGGEIFEMKGSKSALLFSSVEENKQTADIGIIKEDNIVLVPTFFDNRVVAYKF